jgi:hypothetical protein
MRHARNALAACGFPLVLSGCVAAAVVAGAAIGVGAYKYQANTLERDYEAPYERVAEASVQAVYNLQYHSVDRRKDAHHAIVEARRADDKPVRVVVEKLDEKRTCVKVRVSDFDSEDNRRGAELIHDRILANLK